MKKIITKSIGITILLFILQIGLMAQPVGSLIRVGTDRHISYWNGVSWVSAIAGLPGQSLLFSAGIPSWVNNLYGITTTSVTSILGTSAVSGGNIVSDGGDSISARGVCWSTSANPTVALTTKTTDSTGIGSFVSNITGLLESTTYFVRAYATNSMGTAYGNEISFTTASPPVPIVTDFDGNIYNIVTIGTQTWMAENLKTTHYNNGNVIPNVSDSADWAVLTTGAYCNYMNTTANIITYGRLYNWFAVDTGNLCPINWHVPSNAEWIILTNYLGGESIAGGKLKEAGLSHWNSPNHFATNEVSFTALPGGFRYNGYFNIGNYGYWWSSTESSLATAWFRVMGYDFNDAGRFYDNKNHGFSVRCLRDY